MVYKNNYKKIPVDPKIRKLIEDPSDFLAGTIGKTVKNENELIKLIIMAGISTYTKNPINIGIEAPPSEGKTYSAVETLKLFPKDVLFLGDLSPKALIHENGELVDDNFVSIKTEITALENKIEETEDKKEKKKLKSEIDKIYAKSKYLVDLSNKILLFVESPHVNTWKVLRPILSHDVSVTTYKITDKINGKLKTKTVLIKGWPAVIYTKAEKDDDRIWDQIKSRFIIVSPNMSVEKYKASMKVSSQRQLTPKTPESLKKSSKAVSLSRNYITVLKYQINLMMRPYNQIFEENPECIKDITMFWCPFQEQLIKLFPTNNGQNMRDFNTFLNIMKMSALLNLLNRPIIQSGRNRYIVITNDDFQIAKKIFNRGTVKIKNGQQLLDFYEKVLLPLWNEKADSENDDLRVKEIKIYCNEHYRELTEQTIRENYLKPLKEKGFVSESRGPSRVGGYHWKPLKSQIDSFIPDELRFSFDDYEKGFKSLNDDLIIDRIYVLDFEKLQYEKEETTVNESLKNLDPLLTIFEEEKRLRKEINQKELYKLIINMS